MGLFGRRNKLDVNGSRATNGFSSQRKDRFMRKLIPVVVLLIIPLLLVGCGNANAGKAKEYMKSADSEFENANMSNFASEIKSVVDASSTLHLSNSVFSWPLKSNQVVKASELTDKTEAQLNTAEAEYTKITDLSGVKDYVDYADTMIKAIDDYLEAIKTAKSMLDEMLPQAKSAESGAAFNPVFGTDYWKKIDKSIKDGGQASDDATGIKENKNLSK